jgi:hypothetical protein
MRVNLPKNKRELSQSFRQISDRKKLKKILKGITFFTTVISFSPLFSAYSYESNILSSISKIEAQKLNDNSTLFEISSVKLNIEQIFKALEEAQIINNTTLSLLNKLGFSSVGEITIAKISIKLNPLEDEKIITLKNISSSEGFLKIPKISIYIKGEEKRIEIKDTTLNISQLFKKMEIPPIRIPYLVIKTNPGGSTEINLNQIALLGGSIEKINLKQENTRLSLIITHVKNLDLGQLIENLKKINPSLQNLQLEGILNLSSLKILKDKNIWVKIKNFNLVQSEGGIYFDSVGFDSENGLKAEGTIEGFYIGLDKNNYVLIDGEINPSRSILANTLDLSIETPSANINLNGKISLTPKLFKTVIDKIGIKVKNKKNKKEKTKEEKKGINLENINIALPKLPLDLAIGIKEIKIKLPIQVPKVELNDIKIKNTVLTYSEGVYTFHSSVCYIDLYGYALNNNDIGLTLLSVNNPLSAISGCFIKSIKIPYLKGVFWSGWLNLYGWVSIPEGALKNINGAFKLSLLNGYFYAGENLYLPGPFQKIYSTLLSFFRYIGFDIQEFNYMLYSAGFFAYKNKAIESNINTFVLTKKPLTIAFRGDIKVGYAPSLMRGFFTIEGFTRFPLRTIRIYQNKRF